MRNVENEIAKTRKETEAQPGTHQRKAYEVGKPFEQRECIVVHNEVTMAAIRIV